MSKSELSPSIRAILEKPRWSRSDAEQILAFGESSGLSVNALARALDVGAWRLHWWRSELGKSGARVAAPAIEFVPVTPTVPPATDRAAEIELTLSNGHRLSIGSSTPPDLVVAILRSVLC